MKPFPLRKNALILISMLTLAIFGAIGCGSNSSDIGTGDADPPILAQCGNGKIEEDEACDDGDQNDHNACLNDCRLNFCMAENGSKIIGDSGKLEDKFGYSVASDGDVIVIGAPGEEISDPAKSSVYVCEKVDNQWLQTARLQSSNHEPYDGFGHSVAIHGNRIVVGAPRTNNGSTMQTGAIYVFDKQQNQQWLETENDKITVENLEQFANFGSSISLNGDSIIAGAPSQDKSGAAFIFEKNTQGTWQLKKKLFVGDGSSTDNFGGSVSIDENVAVVGAEFRKPEGQAEHTGAAYVYEKGANGWNLQKELLASDGAKNDRFGHAVSVDKNIIAVGAIWHDEEGPQGPDRGAVYVYQKSMDQTWTKDENEKLLPSDGSINNEFGTSVSVHVTTPKSGKNVVVQAYTHDIAVGSRESVYSYRMVYLKKVVPVGKWFENKKFTINDPTSASFGHSVALSDNLILIGAPGFDDDQGSAYLFSTDEF